MASLSLSAHGVLSSAFIVVNGSALAANIGIPSHKYRMNVSDIQFRVAMEQLAISMSLPDWNTHSAFLTDRSAKFATAPELNIDGSYRFYASASPDNVERLALNVNVSQVSLHLCSVQTNRRSLRSVMTSCLR